jgi:hypothetical protein
MCPCLVSHGMQAAALPDKSEDAMVVDTPKHQDPTVLYSSLLCMELLCSCSIPDTLGNNNSMSTVFQWNRHRSSVCSRPTVGAMCKCLSHPDMNVRVAAVKCMRVLARCQDSISQEHLGDGVLADTLVHALQDDAKEVSTQVCYAVTNFLSTPSSPARQQLFEKVWHSTVCCAAAVLLLCCCCAVLTMVLGMVHHNCFDDSYSRNETRCCWNDSTPVSFTVLLWDGAALHIVVRCCCADLPQFLGRYHRVTACPICALDAEIIAFISSTLFTILWL